MTLRIVIDRDIPLAVETIGRLGEVTVLPGRSITAREVKEADALVIRSVTRVNEQLLAGSSVKFVGTATIGFDHVDLEYLKSQGIQFASAPGSNANAVAEYVVAALLEAAGDSGRALEGASIAIVGVGNVGSRVLRKVQALGMRCYLNDPPRFRATGDPELLPLGEALKEADFVSLHVPLERAGADATYRMANRNFFGALKRGTVFLNTSRGDVVDETELKRILAEGRLAYAILDVWQGEPVIDVELAQMVFLATPHIAGFSSDGKATATAMVFDAICRWLNRSAQVAWAKLLPSPSVPLIDLTGCQGDDESLLRTAVRQVCDIRRDDMALRQAIRAGEQRGAEFDRLRNNYPVRREFEFTRLILPRERQSLIGKASGLGFHVQGE
jgi:erythronate-4-phosphate dehydrogenase